jgi:DNA (cytosine-5)-methyltransferase 1
LAQRRKRVFLVANFGDWANTPPVLLEPESMQGHPSPRRQPGETPAPTINARPTGGGGLGTDSDLDGGLIAHALRAEGFDASEDGTGRGTPIVPVAFGGNRTSGALEVAASLNAKGGSGRSDFESETLIAFDCKTSGRNGFGVGEVAPTLRAMGHGDSHQNGGGQIAVASGKDYLGFVHPRIVRNSLSSNQVGIKPDAALSDSLTTEGPGSVVMHSGVRRLTPRECERLMGFPDDYTLVPLPLKGRQTRIRYAADGPRYKALGNSFAVPVIRWIGRKIQEAD